jgi:hypothetical protein
VFAVAVAVAVAAVDSALSLFCSFSACSSI